MNRHVRILSTNGFSLIELMVTIAIVMLVTGIALVRYGSFNNAILLRSQAFEIALDIRQAQQYAISASTFTGDARSAFGMYFDSAQPGSYILYQDKPATNNNFYNTGEQVGSSNFIDGRFKIVDLCVNGSSCGQSHVSIAFKRPNFDALLYNQNNSSNSITQVNIKLAPVSGGAAAAQKTVTVFSSGQIAVQ